jgi:hypothetical protein
VGRCHGEWRGVVAEEDLHAGVDRWHVKGYRSHSGLQQEKQNWPTSGLCVRLGSRHDFSTRMQLPVFDAVE